MIEIVVKKKKGIQYFTQETEDAIVRYNQSTDPVEREKIYHRYIHYAFFKLTENIIHTFKFYYTEVENIEDLQHEVITFLLSKMHLYDQTKGSKAYSYFGTIVKRYLILYNQKNYKKFTSKIDFNEIHNEENTINKLIEEPIESEIDRSALLDAFIKHIDDNLIDLFDKADELKTADAILEILRKRENIDIFNKKAIFIYIKEITDVQSVVITKVIKRLKDIYKSSLNYHIENLDN
jgi:hypothetical protein